MAWGKQQRRTAGLLGPLAAFVIALASTAALALPAAAAASAPATLWQVPAGWQVPASIPASGPGAGQLNGPRGIAVDPVSGNLFVVDRGNARIDEFTPYGQFVKAFGWAVDASTPEEELQVCTEETGCKAGTKGSGVGQLAGGFGIAIGANHDLYVMDDVNSRVQVFDEEGNFVATFGTAGTGNGQFSNPTAGSYIAAGPGGAIYVGDVGRIEKFDAAGSFTGEIKGEVSGKTVEALAVDEAGNSYVILQGQPNVLKLGPAGELLHSFPVASPEAALAVGSEGELWAVNNPSGPSFGIVQLEPRVVEFDAAGNKVLPTAEEEAAEKREPPVAPFPFAQVFVEGEERAPFLNGLAASSACGQEADDVFASYYRGGTSQSLLRAYGPTPDPSVCPPPQRPPEISSTFALSVLTESAMVRAEINAFGQGGASYYVEYGIGKCSEGGCPNVFPSAAGRPLGSAGSKSTPTEAVLLSSLQPDTTYHYRFVAKSNGGGPALGSEETFTTWPLALPASTSCPNQAFRFALSAPLPDCRAYEMVSPVEKEGADVVAVNSIVAGVPARLDQSAASGDALTYSAYRAFAGPKAAPFSSQYLSSRGPGGWSTESISPGRGEALGSVIQTGDTEYWGFSKDLCQSWLLLGYKAEPQLDPAELSGFPNLFRREDCSPGSGAYEALTTVPPPHLTAQPESFIPQVQGFSADGRCTVFRAPDALTPEAPVLPLVELEDILYESCGGALRLVAILPDGTPNQGSSTAGISNAEQANFPFQSRGAGVYQAVSRDGTKVYWTDQGVGPPGSGPGTIYLRINADQAQSAVVAGKCTEAQKACTLQVSGLVSSGGARFWTASDDGTRAFFSIGELLYEYTATNPAEPKATLVAEGVEKPLGMLGASADASRIYFASEAVLAPGAVAGEANLYFRERGQSPRFLGALDPSDLNTFGPAALPSKAISYEPGFRAARVSADGLYASFMSSAPLTGFDNTDQRNGQADREVFLYEAAAEGGQGRLLCLSCDPSGARPSGANIGKGETPLWAAARIPTWPSALYPSNALITEGRAVRLFFDSFVPLTPRDVNGKADVYEWESAGSQAVCEQDGAERYVPAMAGCLSLISSGQSTQDSEFVDADPAGRNVFFATGQSLLPQDPGLIDIYAAREEGGFPAASSSQTCQGEACQQAGPAPSLPVPASGTVREGNPKHPKRCPKGKRKVKRKGGRTACVAKKHHKRHHGHKKKHHHSKANGKHGAARHKRGTHR